MDLNIWNVNVSIDSTNKDQINDIIIPSAHSLHTNWRYNNSNNWRNHQIDIIDWVSEKIKIILGQNNLSIIWDFNFSSNELFNPQFWISWNKWIISKYISHINELNWVISFHACSLIHPISGRVILWIWASWGWKTALISNWLLQWWEIIWTEMVQINTEWNILIGNSYDTIWKNAEFFFDDHRKLKVNIDKNDKIFDQTGAKCLADFWEYMYDWWTINIKDCEIVFLQYWDDNFTNWTIVTDHDMALRFLMHSASEKIESPTCVWNNLLNVNMYGDINFRNQMIHDILNKVTMKKLLWWNMESFLSYLK